MKRTLIFILALFLGILGLTLSCKTKKSSSSQDQTAKNLANCPAPNLSLLDVTAPANVPAQHMSSLGLDFSVESATQNGVVNFLLSIIPNEITPYNGMPDELKGRTADFPRVSVCDAEGNCVAIKNNEFVAQKGGTFDFPFWSGIVALPASMKGTIFFSAQACTYVRAKDEATGLMLPSGKSVCSPVKIKADPAQIYRPASDPDSVANTMVPRNLQLAILGLGTYLYPYAQAYLASLKGAQPTEQMDQILAKLAAIIVNDPSQVGAFLAGSDYDEFRSSLTSPESDSGLALDNSTQTCQQAVASALTNNAPTPVPPPNNTPEGTLTTQTVTNTETTTQLSTVTVSSVTTDVKTAYGMLGGYDQFKIRLVDSSSRILGCLQRNLNKVDLGTCSDSAAVKWNLKPSTSSATSFQIQSQDDKSLCMIQNADKTLGVVLCDQKEPEAQLFRMIANESNTTAPSVGGVVSSAPYNFYAVQGGVAAACVETSNNSVQWSTPTATATATGTTTGTETATAPKCSSSYSIDPYPEPAGFFTSAASYAGVSRGDMKKFYVGMGVGALGLLTGIVGGAVWNNERVEANRVKKGIVSLLKISYPAGPNVDDLDTKKASSYSFKKLEEIYHAQNLDTSHGNAEKLAAQTQLVEQVNKYKTKYESGKFRFGAGLISILGVVAGSAVGAGLMYSSLNLADDAKTNFINALISAGTQFNQLKAQLEASGGSL